MPVSSMAGISDVSYSQFFSIILLSIKSLYMFKGNSSNSV